MILITGARGFVGSKLMETLPDTVASPSLKNASQDDICRIVEESGADVIIHTAAISNTGICQNDPEASYIANVQLPVYLARAAAGRKLVCFSSDQVYNGADPIGPYREEDARPASVYAEHKLLMENKVLDISPDAVMLRAEWMYDYCPTRGNYLMNLLNAEGSLGIADPQFRGVTYLREVAENMEKVIRLPGGAYNFGSETTRSIYDITVQFAAELRKDLEIRKEAPRHDLFMNCDKARKYGVEFSEVFDGLKKCVQDYGLI